MRAASLTGNYPGEKTTVERMKALRTNGMAYDKLAGQLTTECFRTRKGTAWHGFSVQSILARCRWAARYVVVNVTFHTNPRSSSLRRRSGDSPSWHAR